MKISDTAEYFSKQVLRTRRFFIEESKKQQVGQEGALLVAGGCEWCAPDFVIDRKQFPFVAFEFVARGGGHVTLAGRRHELSAGHAFFYDPATPHVIQSDNAEPMVKYFFNLSGSRAGALLEDLERRGMYLWSTIIYYAARTDRRYTYFSGRNRRFSTQQ